MLNILFVSCYSADINNSASIELVYYMNLLARSGEFKVHLLTMNFPESTIYYDCEISKIVHKDIIIHRVDGGFIINKVLPKKGKGNHLNQHEKVNSTLIKIKNLLNIVDPYLGWAYKAFGYFKKNLFHVGFDIIIGMHEPPSSLICSYMIKNLVKKNGSNVRLVSYFSDPYCDEVSRRSKGYLIRKINDVIESKVTNMSDKFLFVTENNLNYFVDKYKIDINDISLIHRNFDRSILDKFKNCYPSEFIRGKINLLHAGDIVRDVRDISEFISSLDNIFKNNKENFEKFNINFYGNIKDDVQLKLVRDREYINYKPRISYFKIMNFMVHADVLLIFGNKEFKQIPAKIYDYLGTNAYILVILESYDDPLYKLVKCFSGVICTLNNSSDITKTLLKLLDMKFDRDTDFDRNKFVDDNILNRFKKVFFN